MSELKLFQHLGIFTLVSLVMFLLEKLTYHQTGIQKQIWRPLLHIIPLKPKHEQDKVNQKMNMTTYKSLQTTKSLI